MHLLGEKGKQQNDGTSDQWSIDAQVGCRAPYFNFRFMDEYVRKDDNCKCPHEEVIKTYLV